MLKKLAIAAGAFVVLLFILMAALPFIIDIDQHRPEIVKAINDNINGTASIEKLSLSLWGKVEVEVNNLEIKNLQGKALVSVGKAYVLLPFSSLLLGPELTVQLAKPDLYVKRFADGKINLLSLVKEKPAGAADAPADSKEESAEEQGSSEPVKLPSYIVDIIQKATFNFELLNSKIVFEDVGMKFQQELHDFNITLYDVSLSKQMHLKIWSDIKTKLVGTLDVTGPILIEAFITPKMNELEFESADVSLTVNLDGIDVVVPDVFRKKPKVPTNIKLQTVVSPKNIDVNKFEINFHNMTLNANAHLKGLDQPSPQIYFKLDSNKIDLAPWKDLVEPLGALGIKGEMILAAGVNGSLSDIRYSAGVDINKLSVDLPVFKDKPVIDIVVRVVTNEIKQADVKITGKGTDLNVFTTLKDFAKPNIKVNVVAKQVDLDAMLGIADEIEKTKKDITKKSGDKKDETTPEAPAQDVANQPVENVDKNLDELRNNEFVKGVVASLKVDIDKFKAANIDVTAIKVDLLVENLAATIKELRLNIFKGSFSNSMNIDLKPQMPTYGLNLKVDSIDIAAAIESNLEFLKNTLLGQISLNAQGSGQSLNSDKLLGNLKLAGDFKVVNATFASVDVTKMASEGANNTIEDFKKKYPQITIKNVGNLGDKKSTYEFVGSDFSMNQGVFKAPNFLAKAKPNNGIDIKGYTELDLLGDKITAKWNIVDTYNWTKLADVSISAQGVRVDRLFAEGNDAVRFPASVGCKLSEPCYDTTEAGAHLLSVAANNIKNAVSGRLNAELDKRKAQAKAAFDAKKAEAQKKLDAKKQEAQQKVDAKKAEMRKKAEEKKKQEEEKAKSKVKDKLKKKFGF